MNLCYREINFFIKESTLIYCLTLFTFAIIGLFLFIQNIYSYFERRKIPRGALPKLPFGNIKDVLFDKTNFYIHLWKYYNKFKRLNHYYGGLYLALKPSVLFIDPFLIFTVLSDDDHFKDISGTLTPKTKEKLLKIFNNDILKTLLKKYGNLEKRLIQQTNNKVDQDIKTFIKNFYVQTTNIITGFTEDEVTKLYSKNQKISEGNLLYFLKIGHPKLFNIFKSPKSNISKVKNIIQAEINNRKKNDLKKCDVIHFISELIDGDEEQINFFINEFILENLRFTENITQFCFYEICKNPDIQEELIGEIRRFRNENEEILLEHVWKLTSLDSVVKETLRKYPPYPYIVRKCSKNFKNEKYNLSLPKDCLALISVYGVHHDPINFPNPEEFDPDRFSEENKAFIKPCTFIPFGVNFKTKIGMIFMMLQVKLLLISVVSNFRIKFSTKSDSKIEFDNSKLFICSSSKILYDFVDL